MSEDHHAWLTEHRRKRREELARWRTMSPAERSAEAKENRRKRARDRAWERRARHRKLAPLRAECKAAGWVAGRTYWTLRTVGPRSVRYMQWEMTQLRLSPRGDFYRAVLREVPSGRATRNFQPEAKSFPQFPALVRSPRDEGYGMTKAGARQQWLQAQRRRIGEAAQEVQRQGRSVVTGPEDVAYLAHLKADLTMMRTLYRRVHDRKTADPDE